MLDFKFNPASMAVPGYLEFQSILNIVVDLRGAFDFLDIYPGKDAQAFVEEKITKMVPPDRVEDVTEMCLAFAVMSVAADRTARGERPALPLPREAVEPSPEPGSEAHAEAEQTTRVHF